MNVQTSDIVEPKNKIIKNARSDCLRSDGFGIVIRRSFFDLYPAEISKIEENDKDQQTWVTSY